MRRSSAQWTECTHIHILYIHTTSHEHIYFYIIQRYTAPHTYSEFPPIRDPTYKGSGVGVFDGPACKGSGVRFFFVCSTNAYVMYSTVNSVHCTVYCIQFCVLFYVCTVYCIQFCVLFCVCTVYCIQFCVLFCVCT